MKASVNSTDEDRLLTTDEAATLLAVSPQTMKWWRKRAHRAGPNFIKVERSVRYPLLALRKWLSKRTVRTQSLRRAAPFYRRTRIEELGAKHPGVCKFVDNRLRRRVPHPQIAAAILARWGEKVSAKSLSSHYASRVWPKILDEERSQVSSR